MRRVVDLALGLTFLVWLGFSCSIVFGRDVGQWKSDDPAKEAIREWYQALMQPDNPRMSCCGESDAYWADDFRVRDGKSYAVVTDDRDDAPLHRSHIDVGTEIEVPPNKIKWDRGNPTGHGILFLSRAEMVWCYVMPGGV